MNESFAFAQAGSMSKDSGKIFNELINLRLALTKSSFEDEADELAQHMRQFWFYSLFDSAAILTIAGPQGVGKSTMVNTLLSLSKKDSLPVGEGSCEHIPIILVPAPETEEESFAVVHQFQVANGARRLINSVRISLDEARKRAMNPQATDQLIIWNLVDCPSLNRISPLAVLPGLELESGWQDSIRFTLDISDIVLYTVDSTRKAQDSASVLESWMEELDSTVLRIAVLTKSDMMSREQVDSALSTMSKYEPIAVGQDKDDMSAQYEFLWEKILGNLLRVPPRNKSRKFVRLIRATKRNIKSVHAKAMEEQRDIEIDELVVVDRVIGKLTDHWSAIVRTRALEALESQLSKAREKAIETGNSHRKEITEGFWKKTELWFSGGPSADSICSLENDMRESYTREMQANLEAAVKNKLGQNLLGSDGNQLTDGLDRMMSFMLLVPTGSWQKEIPSMITSIQEAGQITKAGAEYVESVAKGVQSTAEQMGKISAASRKSEAAQLALGGTLATAGTATTGVEIAQAGVAGLAPSVIVGIAGATVAAIAAAGMTCVIIRNARDVEWQLHTYVRAYANGLYECAENIFIKRIDEFWAMMQFEVRSHLLEQLGLNDRDRHAISLQSSLRTAKDLLDEADASRL